MFLLVTSASGTNGSGYGKLLAFDADGKMLGPFSEDARIVDPRGLGVDGSLLFLNSGSDRILALDGKGRVVRDTRAEPRRRQFRTRRPILCRIAHCADHHGLCAHPRCSRRSCASERGGPLSTRICLRTGRHSFSRVRHRPRRRRRQHYSGVRSGRDDQLLLESPRSRSQPARPHNRAERKCDREQ